MTFKNRFSCLLLIVVAALATAAVATAQVSPAGATWEGPSPYNNNDLAYDNASGVYLHVYCYLDRVFGRFVDTTGAVRGDVFQISSNASTFAGWPRVAFSSGGASNVFLVVYSDNRTRTVRPEAKNVWGQVVRFNGSGGELVGSSIPISAESGNPGVFQEPGRIAFNPDTNQFLVPWDDSRGGWEVFVRLINTNGSYGSNEVNITGASYWQGAAAATYDWASRRFAVVYGSDEPDGTTGVYAQVLDGATAQSLTGRITIRTGSRSDNNMMASVAYMAETGNFLVFWQYGAGGQFDVVARFMTPSGSLVGSQYPLVATGSWDGTPDGDCSWSMRSCLVAGQHDPPFAVAALTNAQGTPVSTFRASTIDAGLGTFWPMVAAAWDQPQYGVGYNIDYRSVYIDRWVGSVASPSGPHPGGVVPPPPPPTSGTFGLGSTGAPNGSWVFAEGALGLGGGFSTYYAISNPNTSSAVARVWLVKEGTGVMGPYDTTIAARSRVTLDLNALTGGAQGSYSAVIQSQTAGAQVYVARTMYWGGTAGILTGPGHLKTAAFVPAGGAPSTVWYFAEGARVDTPGGRLSDYFMVFNPNPNDVSVVVEFFADNGTGLIASTSMTVPARGRKTLSTEPFSQLALQNFSTRITSTSLGIVAERSMYWGGSSGWGAGHTGFGGLPARDWYFAEGTAQSGFNSYFLLLNTTASPVAVDVTYQLGSGAPVTKYGITIPAYTRKTINLVNEVGFQDGATAEFHANGEIVVERSMYWGTSWTEGSTAIGSTVPATQWHLPEGSTLGGFETYLLLSNPSPAGVGVDVTTFTTDGAQETATVWVPAKGRTTVLMNGNPNWPSIQGKAFSIRCKSSGGSTVPFLAEEAVYWQRLGGGQYWRGGDATLGYPIR